MVRRQSADGQTFGFFFVTCIQRCAFKLFKYIAPYLVFGSQIRRKEMQKGQVGYGIALRRFCGLRVNVLQPSGARHFNILLSCTVILLVPVILFRSVGGYGLIRCNKSGNCCV
jgi:hypothetical protein